jgi:transcriptional regulator GlxA family with amidase domain
MGAPRSTGRKRKYITSSGVSAGTDMSLAVVEKVYGREAAERRAKGADYIWSGDPNNDPFAVEISKTELND